MPGPACRRALALSFAIATVGCGERTAPAPSTVTWAVEIDVDWGSATRLRVREHGRILATVSRDDPASWRFEVTTIDGRPALPVLTLEGLYPCGWRDLLVDGIFPVSPRPSSGTTAASRRPALYVRARPGEEREIVLVHVDNRGQPEATLALGQAEARIPANAKQTLQLPVPRCEEGTRVFWNGRELGRLPKDNRRADPDSDRSYAPDWLIDGSGNRCYLLRFVTYGGGYATGTSRRLPRRQLVDLPPGGAPFFLEEPPQEVMAPAGAGQVLRGHLTEVPCR